MTKKVTMDLMKFKTVDQAFKTTVMVAVICCLIMGVSFSAAAIYLSNKIDNVLEKALVLDASGQVYNATSIEVDAMRKFEYEDHIKNSLAYGIHLMKVLTSEI